ncbi:MAG TPA: peptidoglycan-associated lipoprotein Pal [Thermoanaerobaculia bacterium]|jgi:peptidoglycan-associated lipoprotein|nr:peptidoglycan-associated lipoprotein Pal [Thermoanaerobaculia bacterium]
MSTSLKSFAVTLALLLALVVPACKKKPVVVPTSTTAASTTTVPDLPVTVTTATAQPVTEPTDFVRASTDTVATEVLPNDIGELNRVAQARGYIADAFFEYNDSSLSSDAQTALTNSATWLKKNGQYNLLIEGHCDERGTEQYNLALGDRRANQAKEYLVTLGVDAARIRTVSYGEERPFDPGHDESAWAKNRRDHLVLVGR